MSPLTLELHFIDGLADGMLTAEVFGWTGHILVTPRTRISEALKREESNFTGVYILIEDQEEVPKIYIGESEVVASRIKKHDTRKDWWTKAIIITSEANKLHKAHFSIWKQDWSKKQKAQKIHVWKIIIILLCQVLLRLREQIWKILSKKFYWFFLHFV